jgi:site-specific recombinase XerD
MGRAHPIKETKIKIDGFRAMTIYQVPASSYWWCRVWINNHYEKKSTKVEASRTDLTVGRPEATKFAKKFFYSLWMRADGIEPMMPLAPVRQTHVFEKVCLSLLKADTIKANNKNRENNRPEEERPRIVREQWNVMKKDLIPFFGKMALKDITFKKIEEYKAGLVERKLKRNTRNFHLVTIRKILKHACQEELLDKMPIIPSEPATSSAREHFDEDQYEALKDGISKAIKEKVVIEGHPITVELRLLCIFMIGSFLRVTDAFALTNSMIKIKDRREGRKYLRYLLISARKKTQHKDIVTLSSAVDVYEELMVINKKSNLAGPNDFVWFAGQRNRSEAMKLMNQQLNYVLEQTGLKETPSGKDRTLGSLRNSAIVFALQNSDVIDNQTLADNCRTSPQVIHTNYAKFLQPEMNVAKIQSRRKR